MHVGVIGLGIGTISSYAREGDRYRFYEINPQVEGMARKHFTFLADCKGEESVIIGDGRVSLEWELAADNPQDFDVLFVDAFSGDSIPIHLLTKEAFELYFQHLKPDGVLAIHITNLHLDLSDPVRNLAADFGYEVVRVESYPEIGTRNIYYSNWVLISRNETFLQSLELNQYPTEWDREPPKDIRWRDDYSNLLEVIMEE
jgi:spermidine synthase